MIEYGFCFRPESGRGECSGYLHLFVIDKRDRPCFVPTEYDVRYEEWSPFDGIIAEGASPERRRELTEYSKRIARDLRFVENIVRKLKNADMPFTASDVAKSYRCDLLRAEMPVEQEVVFV